VHTPHNPGTMVSPAGGYSQGLEVRPGARYLWISGQIPVRPDGSVPATFAEQCDAVWDNIREVLRSANMTMDNLVKVTTFLSDRRFAVENREIRQRQLGGATPALTVIIAEIFDADWLLEIEAVAASSD
jgi:2-iminobutanoate/2-iminopropanoate deaminase